MDRAAEKIADHVRAVVSRVHPDCDGHASYFCPSAKDVYETLNDLTVFYDLEFVPNDRNVSEETGLASYVANLFPHESTNEAIRHLWLLFMWKDCPYTPCLQWHRGPKEHCVGTIFEGDPRVHVRSEGSWIVGVDGRLCPMMTDPSCNGIVPSEITDEVKDPISFYGRKELFFQDLYVQLSEKHWPNNPPPGPECVFKIKRIPYILMYEGYLCSADEMCEGFFPDRTVDSYLD
jgi:hypothetical protein